MDEVTGVWAVLSATCLALAWSISKVAAPLLTSVTGENSQPCLASPHLKYLCALLTHGHKAVSGRGFNSSLPCIVHGCDFQQSRFLCRLCLWVAELGAVPTGSWLSSSSLVPDSVGASTILMSLAVSPYL